MLKQFNTNSYVSFEGDLSNLDFYSIDGASHDERASLTRATVSPELDFVVIPLTEKSATEIWRELCHKDHLVHDGIIHVQIEHAGKLVFGGYDNFHKECVFATGNVSTELLEQLLKTGVIRSYEAVSA